MIIDKFLVLDVMYDSMEIYRGEIRRSPKTKSWFYLYDRLSRCINIFYLRSCPFKIMKELDELISEETPCTLLFEGLKKKLMEDELVCSYMFMGELVG